MSFRASHRFARISPRKVRPLANMVRGLFVDEALELLAYQPQRGAKMLAKVIRSALGNAQDPEQSRGRTYRPEHLVVRDCRVDNGPMFKRFRPRARGMAYMIRKRTSHIRVELDVFDIRAGES